MLELYTLKARRTIFFARYEASQLGAPYIETEHLLLGLLHENKALAGNFLHSDASAESIRKQIEERAAGRAKVSTSVDIALSNESKRALAYAAEEAKRFSDKFIGTEHLMLGLLREKNGLAARLLNESGASIVSARAKILSYPRQGLSHVPKTPGIPARHAPRKLIYNPASETLIVEVIGASDARPATRLFMRHKDKEAYERIGDPPEDVSYESPVTCEKIPIVLFSATQRDDMGRRNWTGLYAFNPSTKELSMCITKDALVVPPACLRAWVIELFFLSEDARKLHVNVGIDKQVAGGGSVAEYHLASLDLVEKKLELLSPLKDVLF